MRPISQVRTEIRDVFHSIEKEETTFYQVAHKVSLEWQRRFAYDATPMDSDMFRDYVFALRYATLALLAVKDDLKRTNYFTRMENCAVDPDTGALYDWRISALNSIRYEAHRDIVDWDARFARITMGDMKTLEEE